MESKKPLTLLERAKRGGQVVSRNKKHMAEIGRKGGLAVSQDKDHMAQIGSKGGKALKKKRELMNSQLESKNPPSPKKGRSE